MQKRRLLAAGTMAGLVGVVLIVVAMLPLRPGVTKRNFDRVEIGMTMVQVEEIFGGKGQRLPDTPYIGWAAGDLSGAIVTFRHGGVVAKDWVDNPETFLDKIRRWLRL